MKQRAAMGNVENAVASLGMFAMSKNMTVDMDVVAEREEVLSRQMSRRDDIDEDENENDDDDDGELERDNSTRGINRGAYREEQNNEDLDLQQVPQVSILDTTGNNYMLPTDGTDDENNGNQTEGEQDDNLRVPS